MHLHLKLSFTVKTLYKKTILFFMNRDALYADLIKDLTAQMMAAARDLQFELAARIRDEIQDLKKELRGMDAAGLK